MGAVEARWESGQEHIGTQLEGQLQVSPAVQVHKQLSVCPPVAAQSSHRCAIGVEASERFRSEACKCTAGWALSYRSMIGNKPNLGPQAAMWALAVSVHFHGYSIFPRVCTISGGQ